MALNIDFFSSQIYYFDDKWYLLSLTCYFNYYICYADLLSNVVLKTNVFNNNKAFYDKGKVKGKNFIKIK